MTAEFNSTRLKDARLLRGLSQSEVAEFLQVSKQAISQYEIGTAKPRSDIEIKMAEILDMPLSYFSMPDTDLIKTPIFFRKRKTSTKKNIETYKVYIKWVVDIYLYLNDIIKLPKVNLIRKCKEHYTNEEIAQIAMEVRRSWGLGNGPISNLTLLLENNGFIIAKTPLKAEKVDACSVYFTCNDMKKNRPMIFLTSSKTAVRSRRDLAHELAHQVLHSWMDKETFELNKNQIEEEAEVFASCFLMPPEAMEREVYSVRSVESLIYMKRRWKASALSIMYHLHDLNLLSDTLFEKFKDKAIKNLRWLKKEPLDDVLEHEHPELIKDAISLLVNANIKTACDISAELSFPTKDLSELCGLPLDFFNQVEFGKPMLRIVK